MIVEPVINVFDDNLVAANYALSLTVLTVLCLKSSKLTKYIQISCVKPGRLGWFPEFNRL